MIPADRSEPPNIFISYRRTDSAGHAGRVQDVLRARFGAEHVFYDVTTIAGGLDFAVAIKDALARSVVVVVVIGPRWKRPFWHRVLSRTDWVRFELEQARRTGRHILPVLVSGATIPRSLPPSLEFLSTINALPIRDESWDSDVARVCERVQDLARVPTSPPSETPGFQRRRPIPFVISAAAAAVLVLILWLVAGRPAPQRSANGTGEVAAGGTGSTKRPAENHPPSTGSIEVDQFNAIGLVSATRFGLQAKGITDADGDPLTYTWDFGDGSPAPPSAPQVTKIYDRVNRFHVRLFVNDGHLPTSLLAAETDITVRDISGTWLLRLQRDPQATYALPTAYEVVLVQQGNQLSGRITPAGSNRPTVLTGYVEHPTDVHFGSEHAWWNDDEDAYFHLYVSDGAIMIQMMNRQRNRCGPQIPCLSALMDKQS